MSIKILIADDEGINRLFVKSILTSKGWQVEEAANGKEALEICSRQSFDLIILDIKMPVMDGKEASRRIREQENGNDGTKNGPILGFTAYVENELLEELKANGIDGIIRKPITETVLLRTISSYLSDDRNHEEG
jgi:CheY-like chemotaxis protein